MHTILVNCPTRQSLLLFIGSLHWLSSWRWWPSIRGGGRLYQQLWTPEMGDFTHFFCKSHKLHISRWRILFLPSCIRCISPSNTCILRTYHEFPKMGVTYSNPHFRKFVNFRKWGLLIVTLIFGNSWKPRKMDLFCGLKSVFGWYFFVFQPGIYIGRWDLQKNALDLVNLGP